MVVDRFKELLNEFCTEPQEEEILGSFLAISPHDDIDEQPRTVPEKKKKTVKQPIQAKSRDIRMMFQAQIRHQQETKEKENANVTIVID